MARPKVITEDIKKAVVTLIKAGCSRKDAAVVTGIDLDNILQETQRDEAFLESIKKAEVDCKMCHVKNIVTHSKKNWVCSAFLLERKWPQEFAKRKDLGGFTDQQVMLVVSRLTDIIRRHCPESELPAVNREIEDVIKELGEGERR